MLYFVAFLFVAFTFYCCSRPKAPINGIYNQEGPFYILKYLAFKLLLTLRKASTKGSNSAESGGLGQKSYNNDGDMDKPQPFSTHANAFDAVFFSGSNGEGDFFVVAAERRPGRRMNAIVYVLLPELGLYRADWLPQTRTDSDSDDAFSGSGIQLTPIESMRRWNIEFRGKLKKVAQAEDEDPGAEVSLLGTWASDEPIFNYDTDMSTSAAARAFAKQGWNKQFFTDLKKAHQSHYEQLGVFQGHVEVPSMRISRNITMRSFRDHSFGTKRDWKLMHRYAFHHIFLSDGWKAVVGVVCQPLTCTSLECGFVSMANGNIFPLESCSLKLHEHGEGGLPPQQYAMMITAGGLEYEIEVDVFAESDHFSGDENESRMMERFANFRVNGVRGNGITEWQCRNSLGN